MSVIIPDSIQLQYGSKDLEDIKSKKSNQESIKKEIFEIAYNEKLSTETVKRLCKEAGIEYLEGYENRIAKFIISTSDTDRDSDVVVQEGILIDDYLKNPIILFAHNAMSLPIGITLSIKKTQTKTTALGLFFDNRVDASGTADLVFRMIQARALRGASIGFKIISARFPTEEEAKKLKMDPWGIIYEATSMFEWSVCSIPANQNALVESKMFNDKDLETLTNLGFLKEESNDTNDSNDFITDMDLVDLNVESIRKLAEIGDRTIILLENIQESLNKLHEKIFNSDVPRGSDENSGDYENLLSELNDVIVNLKR